MWEARAEQLLPEEDRLYLERKLMPTLELWSDGGEEEQL